MKYDLSNNVSLSKFRFRSDQLIDAGEFVELKKIAPVRSNQQNRYLHLIIGYFAVEYGEKPDYVKQEIFKKIVNPDLFKSTYTNPKRGEVRVMWLSSSDLDSSQMTVAIDRFRDYASKEAGIYLPAPNEEQFLKHMEIEIDKNKMYL